MDSDLRRYAYHGCHRKALYNMRGCLLHAARTDVRPAPRIAPALVDLPAEPLGHYGLALLERDCLHRYYSLRAGLCTPTPAELRYLSTLARTDRDLAPKGGEDSLEAARAEIDDFIDSIARSIFAPETVDPSAPPPRTPRIDARLAARSWPLDEQPSPDA